MAQQSTGPNHLLTQQSIIGRGDYGAMFAGTRRRDRRSRQRRGVLLLVCLVLLVMFLMLGVTFVLTAGNFRRSSEAYQRMLERPSADLPERSGDLLDSVAHDLVRGTSSQDSPFSEENLLEDLYGRPALRGKVTSALGGQLKELTVTADADFTPSTVRDYYAGLVLTMLTGKCAGKSTRIVGWDGSSQLTVVDFSGAESPATDDLFLVNGRPFSGDGSESASSGRQLNEGYDKADSNNPWLTSFSSDTVTPAYSDKAVTTGTSAQVDNDGDGEKDSVWMDVGLPLQLQPDGSYVKPLVAMMVRDLDGRVNLNAHGSIAQQNDAQGASAPLGQGYGPAEIDPWHALNIEQDIGFNIDEFLRLRLREASGEGDATIEQPGSTPENTSQQYAFSQYYQFGSENALITPLDPHGNSFYQPDPTTGAVTFETANGSLTNNFLGTTYALELDTAQGISRQNTPYAPEGLERMLRFSDADADAIDSRLYEDLAACLSVTEIDPEKLKMIRERITTESWDLPVAGLGLPRELYSKVDNLINTIPPPPEGLSDENKTKLRKFLLAGGHITDLLKARILLENPDYEDEPLQDKLNDLNDQDFDSDFPSVRVAIESFVTQLPGLGPGLTRGTRFNVNRLFGNGVDDDKDDPDAPGYDVVDDVGEVGTETITAPGYDGIKFDHDGDGSAASDTPDSDDKYARQHYAQQLYLMLMLLADDLETNVPGITDPDDQRRLLARRLAQFAVNAVDYRDPDSIMTPFEYDANPFDAGGWLAEADGDLTTSPSSKTEYGVVWGCESPAAVLTQTLAFHDRRVRDDASVGGESSELDWSELQSRLDVFVGNAANTQEGETLDITEEFKNNRMQELRTANDPSSGNDVGLPFEDPHFDQVARPEGAFFFEVQAVPQAFAPNFPQDLYDAKKLDLAKQAPDGYPIWRVAISDSLPPKPDAAGANRALLGDPPFYALRDADANGEATTAEGTAEAWNSFVTMQPESFDPLEYTSGGGSNEVLDQIPIERIVYFDDGSFKSSSADTALKDHQKSLPGTDSSWDGNYYCESVGGMELRADISADSENLVDPGERTLVVGPQETTTIRSSTFNGGDPIDISQVTNRATTDAGQKLSISEPIASEAQYPPNDSSDTYASPIDKPLDHDADWLRALANVFAPEQQSYPPAGSPQTLIITDPEDAANTADLILEEDSVSANGGQRFFTPQWAVIKEGTVPHYRTAFLQRLADPTMPWNATTNPYLTVDAMPIDLNVYNSDSTTKDPWQKRKPDVSKGETSVAENKFGNYDPEFKPDQPDQPDQLTTDIETAISTVRSSAGHASPNATSQFSQFEFPDSIEPLGQIRKRTSLFAGAGQLTPLSGNPFGSPSAPYSKTTPAPFWPNRPFVSQYELLMVPASEPGKLTFELGSHTGSTESNFTDGFPHLLNFFFQSSSEPQLGRAFDYLHVPSKYAGTQVSLDPGSLSEVPGFAPPFNVISTYREPGRVNLNTIESELDADGEVNEYSPVWEAVMHGSSADSTKHQGSDYSSLQDTYHGPGEVSGVDGESVAMPLLSSSLGFEGTDTNNPFLRYQPINRMGNLTTTRSNVYAVWMTLGFFETKSDGDLVPGPVEAGGSGLERHRAFYMIDRSIPVGYENGHDHNTEDVFRVKRYIE